MMDIVGHFARRDLFTLNVHGHDQAPEAPQAEEAAAPPRSSVRKAPAKSATARKLASPRA